MRKALPAGKAAAGVAAERPIPAEAGQRAAAATAQALLEAARTRRQLRLELAADTVLLQEAKVSLQAARVELEVEMPVEIRAVHPREVQAAAIAPM